METWAPALPIETQRLLLRGHVATDLDDLVVFHSDPESTRYIPWPVRTREQTLEALEKKYDRVRAGAVGDWLVLAIEERSTGTVIGEVLLKRDEHPLAEVGYVIRRDREGQGLASEAVAAMLDLAVQFGRDEVRAVVEPPNAASIRLLERFGFARAPELDHDGLWVFALTTLRRTP